MKHSNAEDTEFRDVCSFSNSQMHQTEYVMACRGEKPSQDRKNEAGGLLAAEVVRREERNYDRNSDCGEPVLKAQNHLTLFHFEVTPPWNSIAANHRIGGTAPTPTRITRRALPSLLKDGPRIVG